MCDSYIHIRFVFLNGVKCRHFKALDYEGQKRKILA